MGSYFWKDNDTRTGKQKALSISSVIKHNHLQKKHVLEALTNKKKSLVTE